MKYDSCVRCSCITFSILYANENSTLPSGLVGVVFFQHFLGGYTEENELSMRAKINFQATQVGEHPNILRFLGAVIDDVSRKSRSIYRTPN